MVNTTLRIVFLGTPEFAVPTLSALLASRHQVVGVVTQPDRPRGRGHRLAPPPTKGLGLEYGIEVLQPLKMRDPAWLASLRAMQPDLGVVAAYGRILTEEILGIPGLGMINVHASLLPRWRGAAPVHRAVMAGDAETGVTIMRVVRELDAGPMLAEVRHPIDPDVTSADVERALAHKGAALLIDVVDQLARGQAVERPQPDAGITYAERVSREDSPIDWRRTATALHNQVRGLHPWPLASTSLGGHRLIILRASVVEAAGAEPGVVLEAAGDRLVVGAGEGALRLHDIKPEGRRVMSARAFMLGHHVEAGVRLG
jgi:methionyl-tRNA formyltransferase